MMLLENNFADSFYENGAMDMVITFGFILNGPIDIDNLRLAFESIVHHFPTLSARMDSSGAKLILPSLDLKSFLWTTIDLKKPIAEVFSTPSPASNQILISSEDAEARMNYYFPNGTERITRKGAAGKEWPLIEVCIQLFTDKTAIGIAWNHLLTDVAGMSIVISSWTKALRGEALSDVAPYNDVFRNHYPSTLTAPSGLAVSISFFKILPYLFRSLINIVRYGVPEAKTIFIPNSILKEWRTNNNSGGVSTNDLVTAWLFKAWASTIKSKSLTISISFAMDLRKHLPDVVPENYLRNASLPCLSPRTFTFEEINAMTHLQLAQTIRSIIKQYTPERILNDIAYGVQHSSRWLGMFPKGDTFVVCSSWSKFNLPDMDFGAKTEFFEGMGRLNRKTANVGFVWLQSGNARVTFVMEKRRWGRGIFKELSKLSKE